LKGFLYPQAAQDEGLAQIRVFQHFPVDNPILYANLYRATTRNVESDGGGTRVGFVPIHHSSFIISRPKCLTLNHLRIKQGFFAVFGGIGLS
jgi:hypothetical protein